MQDVQRKLSSEERVEKQDDSPVTVADYGRSSPGPALLPTCRLAQLARPPSSPGPALLAGAQALVAWSLQRADPTQRLSMVAEEDSASLRAPDGAAMLTRITALVNRVFAEAGETEQLSVQRVLELIGAGLRPSRSMCTVCRSRALRVRGRPRWDGRIPAAQALLLGTATAAAVHAVPPCHLAFIHTPGSCALTSVAQLRSARRAPLPPTDLGASQGGPSGRHWVLDPIDGTRGFVGMRQYSVCLGLLQDGEVSGAPAPARLPISRGGQHRRCRSTARSFAFPPAPFGIGPQSPHHKTHPLDRPATRQVVLGVLGCPNLPVGAVSDDDGEGGSALRLLAGEPGRDVGVLFRVRPGTRMHALPWDIGTCS